MSQLMSVMVEKTLKENIAFSAYLGKRYIFSFYLYTHIQIVFPVLRNLFKKKNGI